MTPLEALRTCNAWDAALDKAGEFTTSRDRTDVDAAEAVLYSLSEADLDALQRELDAEDASRPAPNPTCDNDCTRLGWTEAFLSSGACDLHVSYPPDTDLDDEFRAFCHDEQEMIRVRGWQIESVEVLSA